MKTIQIYTTLLGLLFTPLFTQCHILFTDEDPKKDGNIEVFDDWRLRKTKDDIQIYSRWINTGEEERKAREMKAVFTLSVDVKQIAKFIIEDGYTQQWLDRVKNSFNFDEKGESIWHSYTEFSIPWPFNNQSLATRNQIFYDTSGSITSIEFYGIDELKNNNKKVQRIKGFKSSWVFQQQSNGEVYITYTVFSKMKPIMPRWFTDPIVENGLWNSMNNFRTIVANDQINESYAENNVSN